MAYGLCHFLCDTESSVKHLHSTILEFCGFYLEFLKKRQRFLFRFFGYARAVPFDRRFFERALRTKIMK